MHFKYPDLFLVEAPALAERIDLMPEDELSRARARRFIGQVAMDDVYIDPSSDEAPNTSLLESLRRANEGDLEAQASVRMNTHIAVVESMIKSGHITEISMNRNEHGNWLQHGQAMLHVSANALRTKLARKYPGIMDRTEAETVNGQRIEDLGRSNILDDEYVFVPSLVPMDAEVSRDIAVNEAGFFGDTMTVAFQLTSAEGSEGRVQSAFVAGVSEAGGERNDIFVMREMYALAGYDASNWQPLDFLKTPLRIHKSNLPNGVADIVQLYDQLVANRTGNQIFFGQQVEPQDYTTFSKVCRSREDGLQSITVKVLAQLLAQSPNLTTPESAIELLAELVGPLGVEYAISDNSIDPQVFGAESARLIYLARHYQEMGNTHLMHEVMESAINKAVTSMCGMTIKNVSEALSDEKELIEKDEDCEFISKECPVCGAKNVKTKSTKTEISGSCGCSVKK